MSLLAFLARHAVYVLAAGILIGLMLPPLAALLKPLLPPAIAVLLYLALLRLDVGQALGQVRRPGWLLLVLVWLLVATPLLVWQVARLLELPQGLTAGLVVMAAAPPLVSAPAFALLLGLDASLALVAMVTAALAVPATAPVLVLELAGVPLPLSAGGFLLRLALLVGGCMALAQLTRRRLGEAVLVRHRTALEGATVLVLLVFAISIMDGVAATMLAEPAKVALFLTAAFAADLGLQLLGAAVFWRAGRRGALSIGYCTGNRNMASLIAVLPAGTNPDLLLYFALYQFPIYMLPALMRPVLRRVL